MGTLPQRPEALGLADGNEPDFVLNVTKTEHAGSDIYATLDMGGQQIAARLPGQAEVQVGAGLALNVDKRNICYFDPETRQRIE